jgi:hypothetical protein
MRPGIAKGGRRCMHPAVKSPRNADVALQVAFTLANVANGHAQRQAFVLAHGQLLCSLLSALVDVPRKHPAPGWARSSRSHEARRSSS